MSCNGAMNKCSGALGGSVSGLPTNGYGQGTINAFPTIEEYIQMQNPPPSPGQEGHEFYEAWGYDEWYKRQFGKSIEQATFFVRGEYNQARMHQFLQSRGADYELNGQSFGTSMEKALVGLPMVRTTRIVGQFLGGKAAKEDWGIALWQESDGNHYCWFPTAKNVFGALIGSYGDEDIEMTSETFVSENDLRGRWQANSHYVSPYAAVNEYVRVPGKKGVWFVKDGRSRNGDCSLDLIPAEPKVRGGGYKRVPRMKPETVYMRESDFQEVRRAG